jgi:hypothetical protein
MGWRAAWMLYAAVAFVAALVLISRYLERARER